ncbi:mannose-1-phosphate guanylyltransferase/mannose-6-phosphate isomerase [Oceanidesulfovibrio marinus]|uniref:mannose-1-phosphate guanylyltransferase n=1 Tax=Oceanidesulfovibrio marinus TaxID=370038 RepID=A0A6P1ZKJ3_9BACT|nr:mannose-1-phosphate guanylyltransferase/mannose-6-phosphate isomerase [Oceanidesulfovibrio marinus]TVM36092.1 mannose-1-phosphate guanylyltransferase/mannose-6-phosphate isomerase [Oceanidesulfovibrio marinus]
MIQPVILAGGKGSRLWPLSRELYPKQYITFPGEGTLFEQTLLRTKLFDQVAEPVVVCNVEHRFLVAEQLQRLNITGRIILEPVGRNTAPAAAISALMCQDEDPVLLVMPADHKLDGGVLNEAVEAALPLAEEGYLVAFGIDPEKPETGYGYLQKGQPLQDGFKVDAFAEKPTYELARQYVDSGDYFWNSGIFLFKASAYLDELKQFAPEMYSVCADAVAGVVSDLDFMRLPHDVFASCPSDSVDYAVMEKTDKCAMVVLENSGWSDLGSWSAIYETGTKDANGNVCQGEVLVDGVKNCYLHSESRLVSAVGVEDLVIVETPDAILVAKKSQAQNVKSIVNTLCENKDEKALLHRKVYRPWGSYEGTDKDERFQVKRIVVKPGHVLSLQKHHHRAEHWIVVSGTAKITNGDKEVLLTEDQSMYIPVGTVHRLENPGCIPLQLIEIQTGSYLGEDDIVRLDDVYGRNGIDT